MSQRDILEQYEGERIGITLNSGETYTGILSLDHIKDHEWGDDTATIHLEYHFGNNDYFDRDYWICIREIAVVEFAKHWF